MVKKLHELEQGTFISPEKVTLGKYLERWLEDYARSALRPTTFQTYTTLIRTHIIPSLGAMTLQQLQPIHLQRFYNEKLENGRADQTGGLSPQTVRYFHAILHEALGHAVKWQMIPRNVCELADPPSIQKKEITTLDADQVTQFLDAAEQNRYYIAFLIAITTGLRRGEVLGLRWKDIDFKARTVSVRKNLVIINNRPVLQEPKTKESCRSVTLQSKTIDALKTHQRVQQEEKMLFGDHYNEHDLVVCTSVGTPLGPRNLLRSFHRILEQAKLPKIRLHDLRHSMPRSC
jgi:integrase